ncbi:MAG: hypothetical protein ACTSWN_00550 [Promethearchaeota archaeon]
MSFACDSNDRTLTSRTFNLFSSGFGCRARSMDRVLLVSCSFPDPSWLLHLSRRQEFLRPFLNDHAKMGTTSTDIIRTGTRYMDQ